jgi:uncharacterized protein YbaR (Trm112 family)
VFVELIDSLRCPVPHADSWLVAAASETVDRHIVRGTLGCPVCHAEYEIRDGAVWFGAEEPPAAFIIPPNDEVIRLAALLSVDDRDGLYVLEGAWGAMAAAASAFSTAARFILVSPPLGCEAEGTLRGAGDLLPLAAASVRGIALGRDSAALAESAARALGTKGRLIAPASTPVPNGINEMARDTRHWVGERDNASSAPISLTRATLKAEPRKRTE